MRMWELASGLFTPLSEEEDALINKIINNQSATLSEREQIVAQRLVSRDVLIREDHEEHDRFKINYRVDVWRD